MRNGLLPLARAFAEAARADLELCFPDAEAAVRESVRLRLRGRKSVWSARTSPDGPEAVRPLGKAAVMAKIDLEAWERPDLVVFDGMFVAGGSRFGRRMAAVGGIPGWFGGRGASRLLSELPDAALDLRGIAEDGDGAAVCRTTLSSHERLEIALEWGDGSSLHPELAASLRLKERFFDFVLVERQDPFVVATLRKSDGSGFGLEAILAPWAAAAA